MLKINLQLFAEGDTIPEEKKEVLDNKPEVKRTQKHSLTKYSDQKDRLKRNRMKSPNWKKKRNPRRNLKKSPIPRTTSRNRNSMRFLT